MAWKGWENFDPGQHERAVRKQGNDDSPKKSKYSNRKVAVDGLMFDSKKEAARWRELRMEQSGGMISDLRRQVPFDLTVMPRDPSVNLKPTPPVALPQMVGTLKPTYRASLQ